ncbi:MAG TPA: branched-chain-amino-acid transaminase [bacterium]|nr:branched-chain-amino-acid transaminase [bacterium]
MGLLIYLNGKLVPEEQAKISVFDHGLLYGDGVFEGLRSYQGRIFCLEEHLQRLYWSAHGIMLEVPLSSQALRQAVMETVKANKLKDSYIRIVVTRGVGDLGLDPRKCPRPTIFIIASKIQLYPESYYEKGLKVVTVATRRNLHESVNPAIKSLNYLNNILAKIEANHAGADEGLILNHAGYVSECTGENIFVVHGQVLATPPVHAGVLAGVTRKVVMELGRSLGLEVREQNLTRHDIYVADECFLTGTAAEIIPATSLDGRPIGTGRPGPTTGRIRQAFKEKAIREGIPVYETE